MSTCGGVPVRTSSELIHKEKGRKTQLSQFIQCWIKLLESVAKWFITNIYKHSFEKVTWCNTSPDALRGIIMFKLNSKYMPFLLRRWVLKTDFLC